jgi:hypothetical protein
MESGPMPPMAPMADEAASEGGSTAKTEPARASRSAAPRRRYWTTLRVGQVEQVIPSFPHRKSLKARVRGETECPERSHQRKGRHITACDRAARPPSHMLLKPTRLCSEAWWNCKRATTNFNA